MSFLSRVEPTPVELSWLMTWSSLAPKMWPSLRAVSSVDLAEVDVAEQVARVLGQCVEQ